MELKKLKNISSYTLSMIPVIILPYLINFAGLKYLIPSIILTFITITFVMNY